VDLLYDRVLPFYESHNLEVEHILTNNDREYCGRSMMHPYQINLELNDIRHRRTKVATPGPMDLWYVSTGLYSTSSSGRPSERNSTAAWKISEAISMHVLPTRTMSALIADMET